MNKKLPILLITLVALIAAASCTHSYGVFSNKYPASFSCDISKVPFNKTQTYGYFIAVRPKPSGGGYMVKEPGSNEQEYPYTEIESRVFQFGLGGLILGKPYFGDGQVYAYDLACPQCDRASARLSIDAEGTATCPKCHTTYDLHNEGVAKKGQSRPLYRYRATLNGTRLMVHN